MSYLFDTKFPTGRVVITPGASDLLAQNEQNPLEFIEHHTNLDRGNLSDDDYNANLYAVGKALRIFSSFNTESGDEIWVITEADRSVTTILLPSEY
jgi:hypothetical protein